MARKQFQALFKEVYTGTATVNPGSILDGNEDNGDVTITGAALGDIVLVGPGVDVADLNVDAYVTAADTVSWSVSNNTGGTIDLDPSTWNFVVLRVDFSN